MKNKTHISSVFKISNPSHALFNFVDINLNNDQKLFIDPCLISSHNDEWCNISTDLINDFFNQFYESYKTNDYNKKLELLSHSSELNYTKLGYGNGKNGHGNTPEGLIQDFKLLEKLVPQITSISNVIDLPVLITGFNEDGLSDMITNILHQQLNSYTLDCLKKYNISPNSTDEFYTWDKNSSSWISIEQPCYKYNNEKILLTPKKIVRKKYLFSADQYLKRIILEREKEANSSINSKGKKVYNISKKELFKKLKKDTKTWKYEYNIDKTISDPTFLSDYHKSIDSFYFDKGLSDETLDKFIYSKK